MKTIIVHHYQRRKKKRKCTKNLSAMTIYITNLTSLAGAVVSDQVNVKVKQKRLVRYTIYRMHKLYRLDVCYIFS